ncbi:hypothetical protein [Nonomuraea sp. NPDC049480]|uniref:hypothetical protein n=1 Tax=Nonomuraea sp. NPDC049480 TaxID=3364353 RepID=UPI0037B3D28A
MMSSAHYNNKNIELDMYEILNRFLALEVRTPIDIAIAGRHEGGGDGQAEAAAASTYTGR